LICRFGNEEHNQLYTASPNRHITKLPNHLMNQDPNKPAPSLYNEDLAPIPQNKRTWGTWNYAALWISMSLCIPT